jgi:N-methylhydantoinase B
VTHSESIHINAGILRCIDLVLPKSSVVNATFPAACGMRYTTAMRVHDLVLGAMTRAMPDGVPAGGSSALVVTYISTSELGATGRVVVANPVSGGSGGGPDQDGISGTDMTVAFLRNVPVEILESEAPVIVRCFGLTPDSEGAGKFRGGFGVAYELEILHPSAVVVMRGKDRHRFSAWGAAGGGAGATGGNVGTRRGEAPQIIGKRTVYRPELGEVIRIWSGGGGGFGNALERDPAAVADDVGAGLVSPERARDVYGVAVSSTGVDVAATRVLRDQLKNTGRHRQEPFDLGPARSDWERLHGDLPKRIAAWLPRLPAGVRRYAQSQVYRHLHALGPGPYAEHAIASAISKVARALGCPDQVAG